MPIEFHKYQGAGNDFIVIDNRRQEVTLSHAQVKAACDRRFGIGADGLMLLENAQGYDFRMIYYNSDGNQSSLCGNGGRCITAFANALGVIGNNARFLASDGPHEAVMHRNATISLKMPDVKDIEAGEDYYYLDTGSPHFVRFVNEVEQYDVVGEGKRIRYSERFANEGTNVNFIEKKEEGLFVRTYERGVEDETLSCGTGVTAAALVAALKGLSSVKNHCKVLTRGGHLDVAFEKVLERNFYNIWLTGPAELVFTGTIDLPVEVTETHS